MSEDFHIKIMYPENQRGRSYGSKDMTKYINQKIGVEEFW